MAEAAEKSGMLDAYPNVDGIVPIVNGSGCGMANRSEGYDILLRRLSGYTSNPNFGAILLAGLGCAVLQLADLAGDRKITADEVRGESFLLDFCSAASVRIVWP